MGESSENQPEIRICPRIFEFARSGDWIDFDYRDSDGTMRNLRARVMGVPIAGRAKVPYNFHLMDEQLRHLRIMGSLNQNAERARAPFKLMGDFENPSYYKPGTTDPDSKWIDPELVISGSLVVIWLEHEVGSPYRQEVWEDLVDVNLIESH